MTRPVLNPNPPLWAGDHLLLALRRPDQTTDTTAVSYYRTQWSPAGAGQAALVISDAAGGHRAIYTDNPTLTTWLQTELVRPENPFRERSLPVRPARFETTGSIADTWRTVIRAEATAVVLTWTDFEPPLYLEAPDPAIRAGMDIFSLIAPARTGVVEIDGQRAAGSPYPNETWRAATGQARSSALIAICEVLLRRQV
jgi:hypothetical protein